jgi:hypothetical protein
MLTATITHPFYFLFGADPERVTEPLGLYELTTPAGMSRLCDSSYRLFHNCLPLYDQIIATQILEEDLNFLRPAPGSRSSRGLTLLRHLFTNDFATFEETADEDTLTRAEWGTAAERDAIRRQLLTPELVEWMIASFPFGELSLWHEEAEEWIGQRSVEERHEVVGRVHASLRGETVTPRLSDGEEAVRYAVSAVVKQLVAFSAYSGATGHDVYAFKYYMPLLVGHAIRDRTTTAGLRSFSLVLPVIDSPESYTRARESFTRLRRAVEDYQTAVAGGANDDIFEAYSRLDAERLTALKREFDNAAESRPLMTVTCLLADVGPVWQRYFLPDDCFRLSLAMQHFDHLTSEQATAFGIMLDSVLLATRDLGSDGSVHRALLAACACQPLLDFVILSQFARLQIPEPTSHSQRTLGPRWQAIKDTIATAGSPVGKPLEYLGEIVLKRRNGLSHPAK